MDDYISTYSREDAIRDGVLVDVSDTAREAGFTCSVAVTSAVWNDVVTPRERDRDEHGQSEAGRLWDILSVLRHVARGSSESSVSFRVLVVQDGKRAPALLRSVIGPGDAGEPVITVLTQDDPGL